jgi:hypothetical protein
VTRISAPAFATAQRSLADRAADRLDAVARARPDRAVPLAVAGAAAIVLAQGMSLWTRWEEGSDWPRWLLVALVLLAAAPLLPHALDGALAGDRRDLVLRGVLAAGIAIGAWELLTTTSARIIEDRYPAPGRWLDPDRIRGLLAIGALVALTGLARRPPLRRAHLPVLLVIVGVAGAWVIAANPAPRIDVWTFQRDAVGALTSGVDPYAVDNANIYTPDEVARTYPAGAVEDGRVHVGYTYPPLTLLAYVPAQLLTGDVRYGNLVAWLGAIGLIALARPGPLARGAAAMLAFSPLSLFVLHESFTEPITLLLLAATVAAAVRAPRWTGAALGLLIVSKQHLLLVAPMALLLLRPGTTPREAGRQALAAVATAALVTLPFFAWDPGAMWRSLVEWYLALPARPESFALTRSVAQRIGEAAPALLTVGAVAAAWIVGLVRLAWTPSGFAFGVALVLGALFAFGKQAFPSYHLVTVGAICLAIAVARPGRTAADAAPRDGESSDGMAAAA